MYAEEDGDEEENEKKNKKKNKPNTEEQRDDGGRGDGDNYNDAVFVVEAAAKKISYINNKAQREDKKDRSALTYTISIY